jgi:hypothetical protein
MVNNEVGPENEIFKTDILDKLYQLFKTIDETAIYNSENKIYSYKSILDDTNIFIMIDRNTLQKILEKIPRPKKRYKKSNKE